MWKLKRHFNATINNEKGHAKALYKLLVRVWDDGKGEFDIGQ